MNRNEINNSFDQWCCECVVNITSKKSGGVVKVL